MVALAQHGARPPLQRPLRRTPAASFDHLVGTDKKFVRHSQTKGFGGLEIDPEVELGRLLHRQIPWSVALENAIDIRNCLPVQIEKIEAVIDQAALGGRGRYYVDRRGPVARRQIDRRSPGGEDE